MIGFNSDYKCGYDNISLEKGMYQGKEDLSKLLESIDPSEHYKGTALEGLDAYERQLKRFDITASGDKSDTVEKFFQSSQSSVLFPEFIRRCVESGMKENQTVKDIVAVTTKIDGMDYRSICAEEPKLIKGSLSCLQIKTNDNLCLLHKRGRCLETSYEALRFQRISIFSNMLKQIGQFIRKMQLFDALMAIESVDCKERFTLNQGEIGITDIHSIAERLDTGGFNLNVLLGSTTTVSKLKEKFGDTLRYDNGSLYLGNIKVIPTFDALMCKIAGIDSNYALEMVECGGIEVDYDRLIDKQFERTSISCRAGFSLIHPKAIEARKW
jgi:hypothetical protein